MEIDWKIIRKVALGEATEEEIACVERWAAGEPERESFLDHSRKYYGGNEIPDDMLQAEDIDLAWKKVKPRTRNRTGIRRYILTGLSGAAAIAGLILGFWLYMDKNVTPDRMLSPEGVVSLILPDGTRIPLIDLQEDSLFIPGFKKNEDGFLVQKNLDEDSIKDQPLRYHEIVVPVCGEYQFTLADGSRVILNAGSRIRFPEAFTGRERKVFLTGEAYFDVAHRPDQPFIIDVRGTEVGVLGTSFNIKAYEDDPAWITLVSGSVAIRNQTDTLLLTPGQQCRVDPDDASLSMKQADLMVVLAWKNGEFIFKDTPLGDIIKELSRWYDMEVEYAGDKLDEMKFYIYAERSKTLPEVLEKIARTEKINYRIKGRKVVISKR